MMTDEHEGTRASTDESAKLTVADEVSDPSMVPMNDAAGGPTADKDEEPSAEEGAEQLGDFA